VGKDELSKDLDRVEYFGVYLSEGIEPRARLELPNRLKKPEKKSKL